MSGSLATTGVTDPGQMLHGQVPGGGGVPVPTVTVRPAEGVSVRELSSVARVLMVTVLSELGVQAYDQLALPVASRQVVPLSTETSTAPTLPPVSVAVPVIVIG